MNKKSFLFFYAIFSLATMLFLTSCDSLWDVQDGFDVSMNINLQDLVGSESTSSQQARSNTPALIDSMFDSGDRIKVSLHYASSGSVFAQQFITIDETTNLSNISVTFGKIRVGTKLYATIHIERYNNSVWDLIFESRSDNLTVEKKTLEAKTYTNAVFLDYDGSDDIDITDGKGITADIPVKNFESAIAVLKSSGSLVNGATIYLMKEVDVPSIGLELNLSGITVKRQITDKAMFLVNDGRLVITGGVLEGSENATAPLISVSGGELTLTGGVILQNNVLNSEDSGSAAAVDVVGSTLIMNNATIRNNKTIIPWTSGGVQISQYGKLHLEGGTVIISGNITDDNMQSNVVYDPSFASVPEDFPVQVTGNISSSSRIGLSPTSSDGGVILSARKSDGVSIKKSNFSSDAGYTTSINAEGHLEIIMPKNIYINGAALDLLGEGTRNKPFKTFEQAINIFNKNDQIFIFDTVTISGNEEWAPPAELDVVISTEREYGYGNPIPATKSMIIVENGASLTLKNIQFNIPINDSEPHLRDADAVITVNGALHIKENVLFENNPADQLDGLWASGAVELVGTGTLKLYGGYTHIGNGVRYSLPSDGVTSPISVEGELTNDERGNKSSVYLCIENKPAVGAVLVEKGANGVINPEDFYLPKIYAWEGTTGDELNYEGDLVYLELQDTVYIDGVSGVDTNYGTNDKPVKTFERAYNLIKDNGTMFVKKTLQVTGSEIWDTNFGDVTIKRADYFTGPIVSVGAGNTLLFPAYSGITFNGTSASIITSPLIEINEGIVIFQEEHDVLLQQNNNTSGAGAILVEGENALLRIDRRTAQVSGNAHTIYNTTSKDGFGAITVRDDAVVELAGAYITGNIGGGVQVAANATLLLRGETYVKGNQKGSSDAGEKNISYITPSGEGYGLYIDSALTSSFVAGEDVIGITPPSGATTGNVVVQKLSALGYHPQENDFKKIFNDNGADFIPDTVNGQLLMP